MSVRNLRSARHRNARFRRALSTERLESRHLLATIYAGFGDLPLAADSYWNGPDVAGAEENDPFGGKLKVKHGSFQSRGIAFANSYNPNTYGNPNFKPSWSGFAYSNLHDRATPGFDNQFSSFHVGATSGFDDANFAL